MKFLKIKNSINFYNKAIKLIPSAGQTFSKSSKVFDKIFHFSQVKGLINILLT